MSFKHLGKLSDASACEPFVDRYDFSWLCAREVSLHLHPGSVRKRVST